MEDTLFPFFWEPPDPHANRDFMVTKKEKLKIRLKLYVEDLRWCATVTYGASLLSWMMMMSFICSCRNKK